MKGFFIRFFRDFAWSILTVWIPIILIISFCVFTHHFFPGYEWGATPIFSLFVLAIDFYIIKKKW
jgi:hypothetical protein